MPLEYHEIALFLRILVWIYLFWLKRPLQKNLSVSQGLASISYNRKKNQQTILTKNVSEALIPVQCPFFVHTYTFAPKMRNDFCARFPSLERWAERVCVCQNSNQMVMEYIQEGEEKRNRQQIASFRIVTSCTGYFKKVSSYYSVYMIDMQQQF